MLWLLFLILLLILMLPILVIQMLVLMKFLSYSVAVTVIEILLYFYWYWYWCCYKLWCYCWYWWYCWTYTSRWFGDNEQWYLVHSHRDSRMWIDGGVTIICVVIFISRLGVTGFIGSLGSSILWLFDYFDFGNWEKKKGVLKHRLLRFLLVYDLKLDETICETSGAIYILSLFFIITVQIVWKNLKQWWTFESFEVSRCK